jgi:hypothetical protein
MAVRERRYQHDKVNWEHTFAKLFREDRSNGAVLIGKHLEKLRVSEVYVQAYTALGHDLQAGGNIGALVRDGGDCLFASAARIQLAKGEADGVAACHLPDKVPDRAFVEELLSRKLALSGAHVVRGYAYSRELKCGVVRDGAAKMVAQHKSRTCATRSGHEEEKKERNCWLGGYNLNV